MKKIKQLIKDKSAKASSIAVITLVVVAVFATMFVLLPDTSVRGATTTDFTSFKTVVIESDFIDATLQDFPVWVYNVSDDWKINETSFSYQVYQMMLIQLSIFTMMK